MLQNVESLLYKPDGTAGTCVWVGGCVSKTERLVLSLSSSNRAGLLPAAFNFLQGSGLFSLGFSDVLGNLVSVCGLHCLE